MMAAPGRGRGYSGRHHARDPRPGDDPRDPRDPARDPRDPGDPAADDSREAVRILAELSPRAPPPPDARYAAHKDPPPEEAGDELAELLHVDDEYRPLLVLLEQFSPGEDGIQFNRKLRQFETTVVNMCPDEAKLLAAFATFRAAALSSAPTARKLAAVGASFTRQQRQLQLRAALLNVVMQGTHAKLELLERANPQLLINAANLMGDYFAEARLCNGNKVHILAAPLLQYMHALVRSSDARAHRSLATQLMQNGRELLTVLTHELDDLSIAVRRRLLSPLPVSIVWLLLSADLCLNKFAPLPNTLQQFYASHLDITADETPTSYSEVNYGSWKKSPEKTEDEERVVGQISQLNISQEEDGSGKPKLRPILGAGAGLLRQERASVGQDSFEAWQSKSLSKRYDLNSWRQQNDNDNDDELVYNPSVLPPTLAAVPQSLPPTAQQSVPSYPPLKVPDYPPPPIANYQENYAKYLQQGDGPHIQSYHTELQPAQFEPYPFDAQPDRKPDFPDAERPEKQPADESSRRPVENWRREKEDEKKKWTRQSKDNVNDDDERLRSARGSRARRNSTESLDKARRHVSDVPRSHKYWDHDDRCDIDYNA